jgi:hypothetical protein
MVKEYAVYKGEELLVIGTAQECAEFLNVKTDTVRFYTMPAYQRKVAKRKNPRNYRTVVKLDD